MQLTLAAGAWKKKLGNEQARLMFYSGAVWEAFRGEGGGDKNEIIAGEWQLRPFASRPHSISLSRGSQPRMTV